MTPDQLEAKLCTLEAAFMLALCASRTTSDIEALAGVARGIAAANYAAPADGVTALRPDLYAEKRTSLEAVGQLFAVTADLSKTLISTTPPTPEAPQ